MYADEDNAMVHCCGVMELGDFKRNKDMDFYDAEYYTAIKDLKSRGCGIFVTTYLPSQRQVALELNRYHTLLFKTGPHKNTGVSASEEGREKGVILAVYKYGKDGK